LRNSRRCDQHRTTSFSLHRERWTPDGNSQLRETAPAMSEAPDVVPRIMGEPTTAQLRQVMNAGRNTRTPSHAASSPQPRQRLRPNSRHQATPPHGPSGPSSRTRSQRTPPRTLGMLEPFGSCHSAREARFGPAMRHRRCVRPTSAIHISKTSTQVPPGYDDASSWTGDSRRAAHFAR
jgi:hypothetical protein